VDVHDAGVLPTPAIAFLTADMDAHFGVMLSASHNAMPDNGIKFFAQGGHKLPDTVEDQIAARLHQDWVRPVGAEVGRVHRNKAGQARYVAHLLAALPNRLDGLTVVIDGAHGAASAVSPEVFRLAGAEVIEIGTAPDGLNINDGYGSTHLGHLRAAVVARGADFGIAHDGDADRCLAVDHTGAEVDGDQIMAILALALQERGKLAGNTLVATVMSNLGLLAGDGARRRRGHQDRRRRPLCVGEDARRLLLARRRAVRTRDPAGARHDRRRGPDWPACWPLGWPRPASRWPNSPPS
jgi:phosphoglucosamine mutase